ncbi:hypothetical protein HV314_07390 [Citrobacter sp. RHBSTW-00887]|uniref:hypothetical protein n=1 Tax=Citrobacter sp. RHBSTW-00887 TaxID=2742668 RepID=UPI0015E964DD|nr:hypothetical protein [Citrobacter sp. RHBSTW-00887]QLS53986.1 hypothetical protein HV314_07390 [Citrobacter sp. RHBSTW-00887]
MGSNIIELAKLGHERTAELKASCGAVDVRSLAQLISDLATQLEVQFVRSTNMAVQLANAESKCRELAAENAALKAASSCLVSEYMMNKGADNEFIACITPSKKTIGTGGVWDMWRHLDMALDTTPATEAVLAEARAQESKRVYESILDNPAVTDMGSLVDWLEQHAEDSASFAAQLRQGAAL